MKLSIKLIPTPKMNFNIKTGLSQFWTNLQNTHFPFLREEPLELTPKLEQVIRLLEFIDIDKFIPSSRGFVGRPPKDRIALARAFVAKAVLNLSTTEMLIDRLKIDQALRRICGFERITQIPDASRFSRAFSEFAELNLPARMHEILIRSQLNVHIMGHAALDANAIEANEKSTTKALPAKAIVYKTIEIVTTADTIPNTKSTINIDSVAVNEVAVATTESTAAIDIAAFF